MPRNASGVYSRPAGTTPAPGDTIESAKYNEAINDLGNETTNSLPRNGSAPMTADLNMGNQELINAAKVNVGAGSAAGPSVRIGDSQTGLSALASDAGVNMSVAGIDVALFDPEGSDSTAVSAAKTVITAEKGDKRYLGKNEAEGTIASAATTDIGAEAEYRLNVTGAVTITSLGTVANSRKQLRFSDALTLTHNATSLILPTGADITTAAGDVAEFASDGAGNWRCTDYQRASGAALTSDWIYLPSQATTSGTQFDFTDIPATASTIEITFELVTMTGNDDFLVQIGDSGGIETTGYTSGGSFQLLGSGTNGGGSVSTAGFLVVNGLSTNQMTLIFRLSRRNEAGTQWSAEHDGLGGGAIIAGGGLKALSDRLTQFRVTGTAGNPFNGGSLSARYN